LADDTHYYSPKDVIHVRLSGEAVEGFLSRIDDNRDRFADKPFDDIVADALNFVDDHFAEFLKSLEKKGQE
jgi:hypothetical protein